MPIPKWMKTVFKAMSTPSDESAGERILNKTIEKANSAKTDEERKKIYNDTAKKELAVTAASVAPKVVVSLAKNPVTSKLIGETAASMIGGESLNQITKDITGDNWGRNVAGLFGNKGKELYDKNKFVQLATEFTNPGYAATNVTKGVANWLLDSFKPSNNLSSSVVGIVPSNMKMYVRNAPEEVINSETFKNLSTKEQNKFWESVKSAFPKQELSTLKLTDYPESKEILKELQSTINKHSKDVLPLNITTDVNGDFMIIPGNLEELGRYHWGADNVRIKLGDRLYVRGHGALENDGLGKTRELWFGGQGDEGLVLPYTYFTGKNISGKMYANNPTGINFGEVYKNIDRSVTEYVNNINAALKVKDFNLAAKNYAELLQIPIARKPFMQQRIFEIESTPKFPTAASRLAERSMPKKLTLFPNLNARQHSIFSGYVDEHPYVTGGYYLTPNAKVATPEIELSKWKFYPNDDKASITKINEFLRSQGLPEKWDGITTDYIGKMYRDFTGNPITKIRVGDFHGVTESGKQPYLLMVPKSELGNIYRADQFFRGLRKGGKFKNPLCK